MSKVAEIIHLIDEELIKSGKHYLLLGQANNLLEKKGVLSSYEKSNKTLKKLLEEKKITHAYQTNTVPKQWRIPLSNKGKRKVETKQKKQENNSTKKKQKSSERISCPNCGVILTIPKNIINEPYIRCLNCGCDFKNPNVISNPRNKVQRNKIQQDKVHQKNDNFIINKTQRNWIIVILIAVIFIFYSLEDKSTSSSSQYYVNTTTYVATNKANFQEMFRYMNDGDNQALSSLMLNGKVKTLSIGTQLNLVSSHFSHCIVRLRGSTQNLWIVTEHITREK